MTLVDVRHVTRAKELVVASALVRQRCGLEEEWGGGAQGSLGTGVGSLPPSEFPRPFPSKNLLHISIYDLKLPALSQG